MSPIEISFENLKSHFPKIKSSSLKERRLKIQRLLSYLESHKNEFHSAMKDDLRRDSVDIDAEWLMVKGEAKFAIKNLSKWMKPHRVKNSLLSMGTNSYYQYEAKGVVLILTPWNAPFAIPLVPLIGVLASGNTAVIKPSELSPATSGFIEVMINVLFNENEIKIVQGDAAVATELLKLPFNHIFYTGSPAIGKIVMKAAAENLTPVTLELGGKNPVIVDASADIDNAAAKIAWGKCANCGQACVAPDYVLVEKSVEDEFLSRLKHHLIKMYDSNNKGVINSKEYARIINTRHHDRIVKLIDDAKSNGAEVYYGGEHKRSDKFITPTIITKVNDSMKIMNEEIFGPLLAIKSFEKKEEAVEYIGKKPKPLSSYFYSRNRQNIAFYLANTTSGNTVVNHNMIQAGINPNLPFGGVQSSGTGRIVGKNTFTTFSNMRSIVKQPLGVMDFSTMSFPPYTKKYKRVLKVLAG